MSPPASLWYVGVLFEIVSTMCGTVGKQLIRMSETKKYKNPACAKTAFLIGIPVNTVLGPIIDMAAYSFAAQSLIAPFGGLDVVWNALLAPYILHETLTRRRLIGAMLIVAGTTMAGVFGNHEDSEYTLQYLEDTLVTMRVLIYFIVFLVWFLLNRLVFMRYPAGSAIRGVSLGCTAGTIAGNMFCVKAAIELIQRSIHEQEGEIWLHWLPYTMLAGAIFFALTNVVYMTKGLQEYEALFMVTIYEGSMIVSGCVSGCIVLLDLKNIETWRVCLYASGVGTIMLGMYVIFSQEAMSKSSLAAGNASIVVEERQHSDNSLQSPPPSPSVAKVKAQLDLTKRSQFASTAMLQMSRSPSAASNTSITSNDDPFGVGLTANAGSTSNDGVDTTEGEAKVTEAAISATSARGVNLTYVRDPDAKMISL